MFDTDYDIWNANMDHKQNTRKKNKNYLKRPTKINLKLQIKR